MEVSEETIEEFLKEPKHLAIVGASTKEDKAGNYVPKFLMDRGFSIIPVNPFADEILGQSTVEDITDVDPDNVDGVIIYRGGEAATNEVKKAVDHGIKWIWLPEGVTSEEGKNYAEEKQFVQDECPKKLITKWIDNGRWDK